MLSRIYKITNDINNKVYVGKTTESLQERFRQHKSDAKKKNLEKRPLYDAINKYGEEHFPISLVEECDDSILNEREQYWIGYYKGYEEGYNATKGGDGSVLYDYKEIESLLKAGKTTEEIVEIIGCCKDTIYKVARNCGHIFPPSRTQEKIKQKSIKVYQYDLSGNYIQSFNSYMDASRWLLASGKIKNNSGSVRTHIGEVCNGKRKTAYGFLWKKEKED